MSVLRFAFVVALLTVSGTCFAATKPSASTAQTVLGSFGGWHAFSFQENDQTVCYMTLGSPTSNAKLPKRGSSRLTVTHRPGDNSKDVFSYTSGYAFKLGSSADVLVGKTHFDLFTDKDTGWARDSATDHAITTALQGAPSLTITGTPLDPKTTPVIDRFTLTGASAAYQAIGKACGYAEEKPAPAVKAKAKPPARAVTKHSK